MFSKNVEHFLWGVWGNKDVSDTISVLKYKIRENTLVASCFKVLFSQRSTGLICIYFIPFVAWWMRSASGCDAKRVDMQHVGGYRAEPGGGGRVSSAWLAPMAAPAPLGAGTSSPHVLLLRHSRLSSAEPCWSHSVTPPPHWRLRSYWTNGGLAVSSTAHTLWLTRLTPSMSFQWRCYCQRSLKSKTISPPNLSASCTSLPSSLMVSSSWAAPSDLVAHI